MEITPVVSTFFHLLVATWYYILWLLGCQRVISAAESYHETHVLPFWERRLAKRPALFVHHSDGSQVVQ